MKNKRSYKGVLYSVLGTVTALAFIGLICGIVFLVMEKTKNYSLWIFGAGSDEILPLLIGISFLLFTLPVLAILTLDVKKHRKLWITLICVCVCATALLTVLSMITAPDNYYTVMTSEDKKHTVVVCERQDGEENEVIFYQILGNNLMRRMSTSKCICEGYRPISGGKAEIEWDTYSFTVVVPNGENDYKRQSFSFITD